jgi:hypothetical protein
LQSLGVRRLSSKLFTFQASSPKPLGRLEPNLAGMFREKKTFEISANQSILLALAAMLNTRLERKTLTLQRTIQGTFLLSLVPIGPVVSEKKLEM